MNTPPLPTVGRIPFFLAAPEDRLHVLAAAIARAASSSPPTPLADDHLALLAWSRLLTDVPNGGFVQFFYNDGGDAGVDTLCELLTALKFPKPATLLQQAAAIYRANTQRFATREPFEDLFGRLPELAALDRPFLAAGLPKAGAALDEWTRERLVELFLADDGRALDLAFTGTLERRHPNGQLAESLPVKKGKAAGMYTEYFPDGSVRQARFYKNGKADGDYWPNGQPRKKETKQKGADRTAIEWFYPSGKLHKRKIVAKSGYAVEPIRLYYENGQLAEELHKPGFKEHGPWLRFFEDGAPRLQAEFNDGTCIVHNAWDDQRRQCVTQGQGLFDDDGLSIDSSYKLISQSMWRRVSELRNGIPHGKTTTYQNGVLWSVSTFDNGQRHGESRTYWDNGRLRLIEHYVQGKVADKQSFPKFDRPTAAVLLTLRADAELYTAWDHMPVDEYPQPLNRADIEARFTLPQFLRDVDARNRAGQLKSDYEDWSTFNDGISYFLQLDETGAVAHAKANGSGTYSGRDWNAYLPHLRQLRFTPARIKGHPVPCRALANVDHTFIESAVAEHPPAGP